MGNRKTALAAQALDVLYNLEAAGKGVFHALGAVEMHAVNPGP